MRYILKQHKSNYNNNYKFRIRVTYANITINIAFPLTFVKHNSKVEQKESKEIRQGIIYGG